MSTGTTAITISDLFGEATLDDQAVDSDRLRLAADIQTAEVAHQGLNAAVNAVGLPVVVLSSDGRSATILTPAAGGTVTATAAVLGTIVIPRPVGGDGGGMAPGAGA